MKLLIVCSLFLGAVWCADPLALTLKSPGRLLSLYQDYSVKQGKEKSPQRLAIFRQTLQKIVEGNAQHPGWTEGLNKFSDMTVEEKQSYLGLNASALHSARPARVMLSGDIPAEKDWRAEGKVVGVKDQASCGSCWTFGAVGPVETNYAILTGKRKSFAEKEYLDCVYSYNGCNGGFYEDCWDYSAKTKRLALTDDAPYAPKDGRCGRKYKRKHNGLMAAVITGREAVPVGEDQVISYLAKGAVGIAFEVTNAFFNYNSGIVKDTTCKYGNTGGGDWAAANHAVTGVGYTKNSMIVKNSWGTSWGMKGYFETARGTDKCEYWRWGAIPLLTETGVEDTDPEYVPSEDDDCNGTNADGCPCGTVRCGDGQCRHSHMC